MNRDNDDWVFDHFAARSRDLTPANVRHASRVLYMPVTDDPVITKHCVSVLSDPEVQRAKRFSKHSDRALYIQRRAFRCFCAALASGSSQSLSEIVFSETENGCPYLPEVPDCRFSFSSCRFGFIGAWSSSHGLGVDLEDPTKDLEFTELARQYFSGEEFEAVEKAGDQTGSQVFLKFWILKEAALKSIGHGLPYGLDAFEFYLNPDPRVTRVPTDFGKPEEYSAHLIEETDGCAALVLRILV